MITHHTRHLQVHFALYLRKEYLEAVSTTQDKLMLEEVVVDPKKLPRLIQTVAGISRDSLRDRDF